MVSRRSIEQQINVAAHRGVLGEQVFNGGGVHLERVHEVLRVPAHAQRVAAPRLALGRLQVAWSGTTNWEVRLDSPLLSFLCAAVVTCKLLKESLNPARRGRNCLCFCTCTLLDLSV